jgi:hypothetical protein
VLVVVGEEYIVVTGNSALAKAYAERDVQYLAALKEMARDVRNESRDTPQDSANQDKLLNKHNSNYSPSPFECGFLGSLYGTFVVCNVGDAGS